MFAPWKHSLTVTCKQAAPMLSLSVFGRVKAKPMSTSPRRCTEVTRDAVTYIGHLRRNEASLEEHAKALAKTDRDHIRRVFSEHVDGWTPFHAFVLKGARKLAKIALKVGVDPNLRMGKPDGLPGRCCPLHLAAHRGDVSLIELLTSQGADVSVTDDAGRHPIFYAAKAGNSLAVRKLLKLGADPSEMTAEQRKTYRVEGEEGSGSGLLCIPTPSSSKRRSVLR